MTLSDAQLEPFRALARAGATPEQVADFAKTQHNSVIEVVKILRDCFDLGFGESKELAIQAVRGISLEQHYNGLFSGLRFIEVLMDFQQKHERQVSDDEAEPLFQHLLEREKQLGRELSEDEITTALEQEFLPKI